MKNYNEAILNKISEVFPKNKFEWSDLTFSPTSFSPHRELMIDGTKSGIIFRPELAQDIFVTLEASRVGISPLDPMCLMIPFVPEKIQSISDELTSIYINEVKKILMCSSEVDQCTL